MKGGPTLEEFLRGQAVSYQGIGKLEGIQLQACYVRDTIPPHLRITRADGRRLARGSKPIMSEHEAMSFFVNLPSSETPSED